MYLSPEKYTLSERLNKKILFEGNYFQVLKAIIFFFSVISSQFYTAQNEYSKWYFGNYAGLDFMTNPPTVLNTSSMLAYDGCASVADAAGNLLFYTNGATIIDKQHNIMANSTPSIPAGFSGSYPIIIKQPGNSNLYYVFKAFPAPFFVIFPIPAPVIMEGLYYTVVDMNLAGGNGSVTVNNNLIYTAPFHLSTTGQIHATRHANGIDYWIVIHDYPSNNFRAYLLNSSGISLQAIVSNVGMSYQSGSEGYLKISPTGQKLGISISYAGVELYDFDNNTGVVSNPLTLLSSQMEKNYFGCEFSDDGTKFYIGHNIAGSTTSKLIQWDLSAGSSTAIVSSSVNIFSNMLNPQALQLAPNGKIYIASSGSQSLSVINSPNAVGNNCNLVVDGQPISATINPTLNSFSLIGLPNILTTITNTPCLTQPVINSKSICSGDSYSIGSHIYTSTGNYLDTLPNVFACNGKTVLNTLLTVNNLPNLNVSSSSTICLFDSIILSASGANAYKWNNVLTGSHFTSAPFNLSGSYVYTVELEGKSNDGCVSTKNISVSVVVNPCDVGIKENDNFYQLKNYPNPVYELLNIELEILNKDSRFKMQLINHLGQLIREEELVFSEGKATTNTEDLESGVYLLIIKCSNNSRVSRRLVVSR